MHRTTRHVLMQFLFALPAAGLMLQSCANPPLVHPTAPVAPAATSAPAAPPAAPLPTFNLTGKAMIFSTPFAGASINVFPLGGTKAIGTASTGTDGTFQMNIPSGQPAGAVYKITAAKGNQTLVALYQAPGASSFAVLEASPVQLNVTTTFTYAVLAPRLEAAGQAKSSATAMLAFTTLVDAGSPLDDSKASDPLVQALLTNIQANNQTALSPEMLATIGKNVTQEQERVFEQVAEQLADSLRQSFAQKGITVDANLLGNLSLGPIVVSPVLLSGSGGGGSLQRLPGITIQALDGVFASPTASMTANAAYPQVVVGSGPVSAAIDPNGNVWVANYRAGTVSKLSSSGEVVGEFPVGGTPQAVAVDPKNGDVWVVDSGSALEATAPATASGTVVELDGAGNVQASYTVGNYPDALAIDASDTVWVLNSNYYENDSADKSSLTAIDASGDVSFGPDLALGGAGVAVAPNGHLWVTCGGAIASGLLPSGRSQDLYELSSTGGVLNDYSLAKIPGAIAIDPSNDDLWVANPFDATGTVTRLDFSGNVLGSYPSGHAPFSLAVDPNNGNVWVGNFLNNTVSELSWNGTSLETYAVVSPFGIALTSASNVWVANVNGNAVTHL